MRVILHGKAADRVDVREGVERMRAEGAQIDVRVTWEAGDTAVFVAEALAQGVETIVAGGGDGSLSQTVAAVAGNDAGERCTVGLLPLGTANDFASACGFPVNDPYAALRIIRDCAPVAVDYGELNGAVFMNVATGGVGTRITAETPEGMKRVLGGAAYLVSGAMRFTDIEPIFVRVQAGESRWEGEVLMIAVGNGRQAGGGLPLMPEASINDGLLDVALLPAAGAPGGLQTLREYIQEGAGAMAKYVIHARSSKVVVAAPGGLDVSLDGEPARHLDMAFTVRPGGVRMHLPPAARTNGIVTDR